MDKENALPLITPIKPYRRRRPLEDITKPKEVKFPLIFKSPFQIQKTRRVVHNIR